MESLQSHLKISCQAAFGVCKLVLDLPTKNVTAKTNQWQHTAPAAAEDQPVGANDVDVDDLRSKNIWRQEATALQRNWCVYQHPQDRLVFLIATPEKNACNGNPQLWSIWRAGELNQNDLIKTGWIFIILQPFLKGLTS